MADVNDALGKLKNTVNRSVATISVKSGAIIEKTKIKTHIGTLEAEIDRLLSEAGRKGYEIWKSEEKNFTQLDDIFAKVTEKKLNIVELRKELEKMPEKEQQILGGEETAEAGADQEPYVFCINCGAKIRASSKFCVKCGARME